MNKKDITDKEGKVAVKFHATWCAPCNTLGPIIEDLSEKHTDIEFVNVDMDEHPHILEEFGVRGIPTIILMKDGVEKERLNVNSIHDSLTSQLDQL